MRTVTTRTVSGRVSAAGQMTSGAEGFAVNRSAAGTYNLIFPPWLRVLAITVTTTSWAFVGASSFTGSGCQIATANSAGALADAGFHFAATVAA